MEGGLEVFGNQNKSATRRKVTLVSYNESWNAMPRFRPPAKLERDALADLWKHTLSNVTTFSGRLIYLAALRDSNSGSYKHYGLIATFGRDEAVRAMRQSHTEAFHSWLQLTLAEKKRRFAAISKKPRRPAG